MIGFYVNLEKFYQNTATINLVLETVFHKMNERYNCYASNYELIIDNEPVTLHSPLFPCELAKLLGEARSLLTCGRFFSYPENAFEDLVETFEDFGRSSCRDVVLVYDMVEIEVYSKSENYLQNCVQAIQKVAADILMEQIEPAACFRESFRI